MTDGRGKAKNVGGADDGRPGDRDLSGHRRPAGAGVRGVHRGAAPVAVVGSGGVHRHHAVLRVPRRRGAGVRDARAGRDGLYEWISWTEIVPPERIALLHGESRADPNAFASVALDGGATRIAMRTVFPTKQLCDEAVVTYHAIEGGQQTLSNLAAYVTEIVRKGVEG
jgi:hypothetical protein